MVLGSRLSARRRIVVGALLSAASVLAVTAAIKLLETYVPVLSLGVLYIFAVMTVAILFGIKFAFPVAVASMVAFDWFFLIPERVLALNHVANWLVLAVYASTAVVVSELAARARRRADDSDRARAALADEQESLRRVATLVAHGVPPTEVFDAVAQEVTALLGGDVTHIVRRESDDTVTTLARWGIEIGEIPIGGRARYEEPLVTAQVLRTGKPARIDGYEGVPGPMAAAFRQLGIRSSVGSPILVEGRLWGAMVVSSKKSELLPPGTEERIEDFTELVATAIANAEARAQLTASRARLVAASDDTRRRIERDLHDGTQQRLVSLGLDLRAVLAAVPPELDDLAKQLSEVADGLNGVVEDLREISRGIHPAILSEGGLAPALKAIARRSAIPVQVDAHLDTRLPERIEVAAYFVVSEALANAAKHSGASAAHVEVAVHDGALRVTVRDDGTGGADPSRGTGLVGLTDRVEALGGKIEVVSPPGLGTSLVAELPLATT